MKIKQVITGIAALVCASTAAHAQSAGSFYVTGGWLHIAPQDSSGPLKETSVGGRPVDITVPGTGAGLDSADTLGLTVGYFVTDHIATEFVMGIPPKFDLQGTGSLEGYGTLGTAKQWSPTLLFKYYFNSAQSKFRPYLGIGVTRTWFSDAKITNSAFESGLLHGPTEVSTDRSWAPVFNGGFTYAIDQHWFAGLSISYVPLKVTTTLNTTTHTVGNINVQSEARIKLNPIVSYVSIGYRF